MFSSYSFRSLALFFLLLFAFVFSLASQQALFSLGILGGEQPLSQDSINSFGFLKILLVQSASFLFVFFLGWQFSIFDMYRITAFPSLAQILGGFLGLFFINAISQLILNQLGIEIKQFAGLNKALLRENSIPFMIAVALVAPLYEELIFRGIMLGSLTKDTTRLRQLFALLWINGMFAVFHLDSVESIGVLVPIFLLGCYFSVLTIWTGTLSLAISLHMLQNFFSGLFFLFGPDPELLSLGINILPWL